VVSHQLQVEHMTESLPAKDRRYTAVPRSQPHCHTPVNVFAMHANLQQQG